MSTVHNFTLNMKTENFYDVIIIGAGIVGLTLVNKLADTALKIAIIDKQLPSATVTDTTALRVSAITPASKQILTKLNLWQNNLSAFTKMHVWTPEGSQLDFASAEIGEPVLGYIIENQQLHTALLQSLEHCTNINFIVPAQLQNINCHNDAVEIIADQVVFNTNLLVGADGANSLVRKLTNIELQEQDYAHTSIIANVTTELSHQQTAWQCFLPTGPLAFLPLVDQFNSSIVWSTTPAEAQRLLQLNDAMFAAELAKAFNYRLGNITQISQRLSFPLHRRHAKHYIKPSIALIGDAAHTIHPLAGQGLNLGILDADCLATSILAAYQKNYAIGSLATLRKYERARKADNILMFSVVDNLKQLFATALTPVKLIRNTGMNVLNNLAIVKKFLIKQAIGARD